MDTTQSHTAPSAIARPAQRWLISRHPGAQAWLQQRGIHAQMIPHLDPDAISAGDEVYGTLPLHLAAAVCARGARFFSLALDVPAHLRGKEICPDGMVALGARLEEFIVLPAGHRGFPTG